MAKLAEELTCNREPSVPVIEASTVQIVDVISFKIASLPGVKPESIGMDSKPNVGACCESTRGVERLKKKELSGNSLSKIL